MRRTKNFKKVLVQPDRHKAIVRRNQNFTPIKDEEPVIRKSADINAHQMIHRINKEKITSEDLVKFSKNYKRIGRIDPIFLGETIYIVGGGSSLEGFNFHSLSDKITIAVNKSFQHLSNPTVIYWSDYRVYRWYENEILAYKNAHKVTNKPLPDNNAVINLLSTGKFGLERDPHGLRDGGNSGYAAINLAYHLGAKKIVLLGFDMKVINGKSHFHEGYDVHKKPDQRVYERLMLPSFDSMADLLKKQKVQVYNASPESAITCFQKIDLGQIFSV